MYISVDVGGTNTRIVGSQSIEKLDFTEVKRRVNDHDFDQDIKFIIDSALDLAKDGPIEAVGIGVPGRLDEERSKIVSAHNLSSWVDRPLISTLSQSLKCSVYLENDGVAAGYGEAFYGKTKGSFDYLIWGTGIGGGEILHNPQPQVSVLDWDTYFKAWEEDCGGAALQRAYGKPPEDFTEEDWQDVLVKFEQHLKNFSNGRRQTIVFGGGLAVKHADLLRTAASDLGINIGVTEFGGEGGLFGGFGLIKHNLPN